MGKRISLRCGEDFDTFLDRLSKASKGQIDNSDSKGYAINFKGKYGDREVELTSHVLTIYDSYANPFSSGSNGYITKARVRNNVLELYHDWWAYGWFPYEELAKKHPKAVDEALRQLNIGYYG